MRIYGFFFDLAILGHFIVKIMAIFQKKKFSGNSALDIFTERLIDEKAVYGTVGSTYIKGIINI